MVEEFLGLVLVDIDIGSVIEVFIIHLLKVFHLVMGLVRQLVDLLRHHCFEESVGSFRWLELFMYDLESVGNRVVFALEGTEASQDLIVDTFN